MSPESYVTIIVTAITVLGSSTAWRFYESRLKLKSEEESERRKQSNQMHVELRERVAVLESKLERAEREKDEMQQEMFKLIESLAAIKVEVEFLRKENAYLKSLRDEKIN
jgi:hypothetical protein